MVDHTAQRGRSYGRDVLSQGCARDASDDEIGADGWDAVANRADMCGGQGRAGNGPGRNARMAGMSASHGAGDAGASRPGLGTTDAAGEGASLDVVSGALAAHQRHPRAEWGCCARLVLGRVLSASQPRSLSLSSQAQAKRPDQNR